MTIKTNAVSAHYTAPATAYKLVQLPETIQPTQMDVQISQYIRDPQTFQNT